MLSASGILQTAEEAVTCWGIADTGRAYWIGDEADWAWFRHTNVEAAWDSKKNSIVTQISSSNAAHRMQGVAKNHTLASSAIFQNAALPHISTAREGEATQMRRTMTVNNSGHTEYSFSAMPSARQSFLTWLSKSVITSYGNPKHGWRGTASASWASANCRHRSSAVSSARYLPLYL